MVESTAVTISSLMGAVERGDAGAAEALFGVLYAELHGLARRQLARQGVPMTLGVTTLLHEAYLNIARQDGIAFPDRARFMAYAAKVMRRLIIDHARDRRAQKRGGAFEITSLEIDAPDRSVNHQELTRIGEALDELAGLDPSLAEIVDLKFFCGFSFAEIGAMRSVSERTVQRQWEKARALLYRSIQGPASL